LHPDYLADHLRARRLGALDQGQVWAEDLGDRVRDHRHAEIDRRARP
jgi:hypothetical protein